MTPYRVMIVDDDGPIRGLLRMTLPAEGFEITEAVNGEQALELVSGSMPDLVLLDWTMPGRSGAEVLEDLKSRCPGLPVIVLTAETKPPHRALAEVLGADAFLTKPFSPLELLDLVEQFLPERSGNEPA